MRKESGVLFLADNRTLDLSDPNWMQGLSDEQIMEASITFEGAASRHSGEMGSGHHRGWSKKGRPGRSYSR